MSSVRNSTEGKVNHAHSLVNKRWIPGISWVSALAAAVLVCLFISNSQALAQEDASLPNCSVYNSGCGTDSSSDCEVVTVFGTPFSCKGDQSQTYSYYTCSSPIEGGKGCSNSETLACGRSRICKKRYLTDTIWDCAWDDWSYAKVKGCGGSYAP